MINDNFQPDYKGNPIAQQSHSTCFHDGAYQTFTVSTTPSSIKKKFTRDHEQLINNNNNNNNKSSYKILMMIKVNLKVLEMRLKRASTLIFFLCLLRNWLINKKKNKAKEFFTICKYFHFIVLSNNCAGS